MNKKFIMEVGLDGASSAIPVTFKGLVVVADDGRVAQRRPEPKYFLAILSGLPPELGSNNAVPGIAFNQVEAEKN